MPVEKLLSALPPRHRPLAGQMLRFGVVGTCGFLVDTATVYASRAALGLYGAGLLAFVVASTFTWALNRAWTFRGLGAGQAAHRQWARFLAVTSLGFVLNRGTYALLVAFSALCFAYPVLATAAGGVAGMGVNFTLTRRLVFR